MGKKKGHGINQPMLIIGQPRLIIWRQTQNGLSTDEKFKITDQIQSHNI
jgi:hypothetical protein